MNRQDQLETIMRDATWVPSYPDVQVMAKAILAAGWAPEVPGTLETEAELDALPVGSVLRHPDTGIVYTRTTRSSYCWVSTFDGTPGRELSEHVLARGVVQLIYKPPAAT